MDVNDDPRYPNIGDIVGCSDGDIGIVLRTYFDDYQFMVEVAWNSGRILTDPWSSKDFTDNADMFSVLSRMS